MARILVPHLATLASAHEGHLVRLERRELGQKRLGGTLLLEDDVDAVGNVQHDGVVGKVLARLAGRAELAELLQALLGHAEVLVDLANLVGREPAVDLLANALHRRGAILAHLAKGGSKGDAKGRFRRTAWRH